MGNSSVDIEVTIGFLVEETTNCCSFDVVITEFPPENPVVAYDDATIRSALDVEVLFNVTGESIFCDVTANLLREDFTVGFVSDDNIVVPKEYGIVIELMRDGVNFEVLKDRLQ